MIVYDVEGWAYHHNARALQKYAADDFEVVISDGFEGDLQDGNFDIILFLPFSHVGRLKSYCGEIGVDPLIIAVFGVGWGYANDWLKDVRSNAGGVIITSYRMWDKSGRLPATWYLSSGVDRDIFKPTSPSDRRTPKVLWCGSTFHRKVKGYDEIILPLKQKLAAVGVEMDVRLVDSTGDAIYTPRQMADWYNTGTVYVCASLSEGTPNPVLEAAACGCTIVTTPVGNAPELIEQGQNGFLVRWDLDSFYQHTIMAINNLPLLSSNMQRTIQEWNWRIKAAEHYSLFRQLLDQQ